MSDAASAQVNAQKGRLIAARAIDESEKRMYVQVGSQMLFFFALTHASHVCSQHSFGLPLRMNGMHKTQFDRARFDFLPCRVKLTQSTALEQKRLDLRSLSPAIPNLWLLLVLGNTSPYPYFLVGLCFDCSLLSEGLQPNHNGELSFSTIS